MLAIVLTKEVKIRVDIFGKVKIFSKKAKKVFLKI